MMKNKLLFQTLLLGFSFPIAATIIQSFIQFSSIDLYSCIKCQYTNYLLWIIDSAPLVLFMFYKIIENKIKAIEKLNEELLLRNKNLEELQFERELFSTIAQKITKSVIVTDADEHIFWANDAFTENHKLNKNELSGKSLWQVIKIPKYEEEKAIQIKKSIENKTQLEIDISLTTKNGNTSNIKLELIPIFNKKREISNFIYILIDVTDLRKQEFELKLKNDLLEEKNTLISDQKNFYEKILNNIPADIAIFDEKHKYLYVNPIAISNPDYRSFIIGKDDFDYCEYRNLDRSIAQKKRNKFLSVIQNKTEVVWEEAITNAESGTKFILRKFYPVVNQQGEIQFVIGYGTDISEIKKLEMAQNIALEKLFDKNSKLLDFCYIISHNLRGPISNLFMILNLIEDSDSIQEITTLQSKIRKIIENLDVTFNELLKTIQIIEDNDLIYSENNISNTINSVLENLEMEINNSGAIIDVELSECNSIKAPASYFQSILYNLISNAIKYRSPERRLIIKIRTFLNKDNILLSITDNGLGINTKKYENSLFKLGKTFHEHSSSRGFGLFITKNQVESIGGSIWLESIPNLGTTFFVQFNNQ